MITIATRVALLAMTFGRKLHIGHHSNSTVTFSSVPVNLKGDL